MSSRLNPLGLTVKWLLLPLSVGFFGYAVVAPRLAQSHRVRATLAPVLYQTGEAGITPPPEQGESTSPDISVQVAPSTSTVDTSPTVSATVEPPKKPRRKHRKPKKPVVIEPAPEAPDPTEDPASGGAITSSPE